MVRPARFRAGRGCFCDWPRQPLAFPLSCGAVRRRHVHRHLPLPRGDAWLHPDALGDRHRPEDPAVSAHRLFATASRLGVHRVSRDGCAAFDRAVLLRDRRVGAQVFRHLLPDGVLRGDADGRGRCGVGRVLQCVHFRELRTVRLRVAVRPGELGGHRDGRQERHREIESRADALPARPGGRDLDLCHLPAGNG